MRQWQAVVPIKPAERRKTRLQPVLDDAGRLALTDHLLAHVLATLEAAPSIGQVAVLAECPPAGWQGRWIPDLGKGLNTELQEALTASQTGLVVMHADLPFVTLDDIAALTGMAVNGITIAPDRQGAGTNAVAVPTGRRAFGQNSCARHTAAAGPYGRFVRRFGLAFDVDLPGDLIDMAALSSSDKRAAAL